LRSRQIGSTSDRSRTIGQLVGVGATHRIDVEYAWPQRLQRSSDGVHLIYLDQKDWVNLAKAASGHADGSQYRDVLEVLRNARATQRAIIPLSVTLYMEMSGTKNARQRAVVANIMEELSGFASLIDRSLLMRHELDAVIGASATSDRPLSASVPLVVLPSVLVNAADGWPVAE
jgi:hypothetical protein